MANKNRNGKERGENGKTAGRRRNVVIAGSVVGAAIVVVAAIVLIVARSATKDPVTFDYGNLPRLGNSHAPVKIVEFGDFKCPACKYFHDEVFPQLQRTYIDTGEVRFYFMNFPFIGPDSTTAAIAGLAIYHQNPSSFWNYYNAMYSNQGDEKTEWATPEYILTLARHDVPGIDYALLGRQIRDNKYQNEVKDQYSMGQRLGVDSTPTLFINGHEFLDFSSWPALKAMVEKYK